MKAVYSWPKIAEECGKDFEEVRRKRMYISNKYLKGIKVIALDIYGTLIPTEAPLESTDCEIIIPARRGIEDFFMKCRERKIEVVSASDKENLWMLKHDIEECGIDTANFKKFYCLSETPKNFSEIKQDFKIRGEELLVIGDSFEKDIRGAMNAGAWYYQVPEYVRDLDDFDISGII